MFTLNAGQISDLLETDESMFLVKCGESQPRHCLSFEAAQKQIINKLMDDDFDRLSAEYIGQLIDRADVSKENELRFFQAMVDASLRMTAPVSEPAGG